MISHRLRGFAPREHTLEGLRAALHARVPHIELDTQLTRDGVIMVHHDRFLRLNRTTLRPIDSLSREEISVARPEIRALEEFIDILRNAGEAAPGVFIDLKSAAGVDRHVALVRDCGLLERTVFTSWRPDALVRLGALEPRARRGLSHIALAPGSLQERVVRLATSTLARRAVSLGARTSAALADFASATILDDPDADLTALAPSATVAVITSGPAAGRLVDDLAAERGLVCVPISTPQEILEAYRKRGLRAALFAARGRRQLARARDAGADWIYVDDPRLFECNDPDTGADARKLGADPADRTPELQRDMTQPLISSAPQRLAFALTVSRILAGMVIPALLALGAASPDASAAWTRVAAFVVFLFAALTDWLDGVLARRFGVVSSLGAALDHAADKALLAGALIGMAATILPADLVVAAAILIVRDATMAGLREGLGAHGMAIPVARLGKWKTATAMIGTGAALFAPIAPSVAPEALSGIAMIAARLSLWAAAILALLSAASYLRDLRRN